MLKRMILMLTTVLALLISSTSDSSAYTITRRDAFGSPAKLLHGSITMHASAVSFPVGDTYRNWLGWTVSEWNKTPSKMVYTMLYDDTSIGENNGQNEVWVRSSMSDPAVTKVWYFCGLGGVNCFILEADVIFNGSERYTTSTLKTDLWEYGGDSSSIYAFRSFQTTAMHELGHAQGLGETPDRYSIMGTDWTHIRANGLLAWAYVGADAVAGSVALYGADAGQNDLTVSHWYCSGTDGTYSQHSRTRLFSDKWIELSKYNTTEPIYPVSNGQTINVEVTMEVMPPGMTGEFYIGLYLSDDSNINMSDRLIRLHKVNLFGGAWESNQTTSFQMTLPTGIPSGTKKWVGVMIDYFDQIPEFDEGNNMTYVSEVRFK